MIHVNDIYASVQGEGYMTGTPMVVLRLQGCKVGCTWCDTKQTWSIEGKPRKIMENALGENDDFAIAGENRIAAMCREIGGKNIRWVMLTGGEPCEQDIQALVAQLHKVGFKVCLETSGTQPIPEDSDIDWICVSPKFQFIPPLPESLAIAHEVKFVVCKQADIDQYALLLRDLYSKGRVISLQPVAGSRAAKAICIDACLQHGFNLSIQMHKSAGIR